MSSQLDFIIDNNLRDDFNTYIAHAGTHSHRERIVRLACERIRDNIMEALRATGVSQALDIVYVWFARSSMTMLWVCSINSVIQKIAHELRCLAADKPMTALVSKETKALIEAHVHGPLPAITRDSSDLVITSRAIQIIRACANYDEMLAAMIDDMSGKFFSAPHDMRLVDSIRAAAKHAPRA